MKLTSRPPIRDRAAVGFRRAHLSVPPGRSLSCRVVDHVQAALRSGHAGMVTGHRPWSPLIT